MSVAIGTARDDNLHAAGYLSGLGGNDFLEAMGENDVAYGGSGDDTIMASGAAVQAPGANTGTPQLYGGTGDDWLIMAIAAPDHFAARLDGGLGVDVVDYSNVFSGLRVIVDLQHNTFNSGYAFNHELISIEGVRGTAEDDIIRGDAVDNVFFATAGDDRYNGRGGADRYIAAHFSDFYNGSPTPSQILHFEIAHGARAQFLVESTGSTATVPAGTAVAFYRVWQDSDRDGVLEPHEKFSTFDLLTSIEEFRGTTGDDVFRGTAADEVFDGGGGNDRLNGGGGYDFISFGGGSAGFRVDLARGTAVETVASGAQLAMSSIEGAIGSAFDDELLGNGGRNELFGRAGNDALDGRNGNDTLWGGDGADILVGGTGHDVLIGGENGLDGFGNNLGDVLDGGGGIDTASYRDAGTSIAVDLLRGEGLVPRIDGNAVFGAESVGDVLVNVENVVGSRHADVIRGHDTANVLEGRGGDDLLIGCDGNDKLFGDAAPGSAVPLDPADSDHCGCDPDTLPGDTPDAITDDDTLKGGCGNDSLFGGAGNDRLFGNEDRDLLRGGEGDDALFGGIGVDRLLGDEGIDMLSGAAGNDYLDGGANTDLLRGGGGNDVLIGSSGFDFLFGGSGSDTAHYRSSGSGVTVDLASFWLNSGGDASGDLIAEVLEILREDTDPTTVFTSAIFTSLLAGLGVSDPTQSLGGVPDVAVAVENVVGSRFSDRLSGNNFSNRIVGDEGGDLLEGRGGNDQLSGGIGADRLIGGAGRDRLTGGANADQFVFLSELESRPAAPDVITDFRRGQDRIDLRGVDADADTAGDQAFVFIGSNGFTGVDGQLRFAGGRVTGDLDGDGDADFAIVVQGVGAMGAGDFFL